MVGSVQADFTAGRSLIVLNQATWVAGWSMYWTNFHAASRFGEFLNTASSAPPTKEVELLSLGTRAVAHLPSSWGAALAIRLPCHGPEKNIGVSPATNVCVTSKPWGCVWGVRLPLKKVTYALRALTASGLSRVNLPFCMMSPPAEYRNGAYSCQLLLDRASPYLLPPAWYARASLF